MDSDRLDERVRSVLDHIGTQALPATEFEQFVVTEIAVRPFARRPRWRVGLALSSALLIAVAVGVTALRSDRRGTATEADTVERIVAVPLLVPDDLALIQAGINTDGATVIGSSGGTADFAAVAQWASGSQSLLVSSAPSTQDVRPTVGTSTVTLRSGAVAQVTDDADGWTMSYVQPDGPIVGIKTTGMTLADTRRIADSMWFITPERWADLIERGGYQSVTDAARFDPWQPPGDDTEGTEVAVVGSLQTGLAVGTDRGTGWEPLPRGTCMFATITNDNDRALVLLIGDESTATFVVVADGGAQRTLPAASPPGLPMWTFASLSTTTAADWAPEIEIACVSATP